MTLMLGALLGAGLSLVSAPWLWPASQSRPRKQDRSWIRMRLAQAGFSRVPDAVFIAVSVLVGIVLGGLIHSVFKVTVLSFCALIVGLLLPFLALGMRAKRRRAVHDLLWPDVIDHVVAAVRTGIALPEALASLATTGPEPLRPQFAEFARDYGASASFNGSLDRLKTVLSDPVADRIIETLRMAREVGGVNLTSILRALSLYLREDLAIRSEVSARQSWVRNAAKLGVAAPWIILALLATRPEAAQAYNSSGGGLLIACGAGLSIIAYRLMVTIGRLPREKRWFQ